MTTATADLSIIIRIEKLLKMAEDAGATEAERDLFQAKALELMERHRIDRSAVGGHLDDNDKIEDRKIATVPAGAYSRAWVSLAHHIGSALDCHSYFMSPRNIYTGRTETQIWLVGFSSDLDLAKTLYDRLSTDCEARAAAEVASSPGQTLSLRRSFILGYAKVIGQRLAAAKQTARTEAEAEGVDVRSTDLVLVDRAQQVNDEYQRRNYRQASPMAAVSSSGYVKGAAAGRQADLSHGNSVSGGRRQIER